MSIIILHPVMLVLLIFRFNYGQTEGLEQPGDSTPALNAMAILPRLMPWRYVTDVRKVNVLHREINCNKNASFI